MDTLNNVIEKWVRDCVAESMQQLLELHGRDANRIAALERRLLELEGGDSPDLEELKQYTADIESRVCDLDSEVEGLDSRVDSVEYSVSDLESTVEDLDNGGVDSEDIEQVMLGAMHSALWQDWVVKAVRTELNKDVGVDVLHSQVVDIVGGLEFGLKSTGE